MNGIMRRLVADRQEAAIMAKMGRPAIPAKERRDEILKVTVTREEAQEVRQLAGKAGLTVSNWLLGLIRKELK